METYQTGKPAPATAMYDFAGDVQDNSSCQPDEEERKDTISGWRKLSEVQALR
jgi:hypothetical protein